jgi:hypothetical protein
MAARVFPAENKQIMSMPVAAAVLMLCSVLAGAFVFLIDLKPTNSQPYIFLLPWIFVLAVVFAVPPIVLYYRGAFSLDNPIVFATFSYFFPAFVIGGLSLSFGWSQPYFLDHIQDPEINLPFTIILIMAGYLALFAGYMFPAGRKAGEWLSGYLPARDYTEQTSIAPSLVLLFLGVATTVFAFILGIIGFQLGDQINSYDGLIIATTQFWIEASFILWFIIFRRHVWDFRTGLVASFLLMTFVARALFAGNRGSLTTFFALTLLAYILSGRQFKLKHSLWAGVILTCCVIAGMIYGTTFRSTKGTESRVDIDQYAQNVFQTIDQVGQNDSFNVLQNAAYSLAERIDILSSVAVVVSNYEQLAPYEEQYGLDNNIWKDTTTFFIPRIIWNDKPVASDARRYGDLYFDYGENSFAITPIGDLLRNYGVIGVPIGMFLLGMLIRVIYRTLVEGQDRVLWRCAIYFMLLTTLSYEGFYGLIIPSLSKVAVVAVIGIVFVNFFSKRKTQADTALSNLKAA